MKNQIYLTACVILVMSLLSETLVAQKAISVTNVAGAHVHGSVVSVSYSIGETAVSTLVGSGVKLKQGFLLYFDQVTGIEESEKNSSVYPNPTSGIVTVKGLVSESTCEIIDMQGRKHEAILQNEQLDLRPFASGIYLLRISHPNQESKTFKIVKQ